MNGAKVPRIDQRFVYSFSLTIESINPEAVSKSPVKSPPIGNYFCGLGKGNDSKFLIGGKRHPIAFALSVNFYWSKSE